jgi:hypothetical protein
MHPNLQPCMPCATSTVSAHDNQPRSSGGPTNSWGSTNATSSAYSKPPARGKPLHLGVIRDGPELYPSIKGTMAPVTTSSFSLDVECHIDTGCLFSNFCKEAIARQLVDLTPIAANTRRVVTLADGSTVSTVGSMVCNLRMTCDTKAAFLSLSKYTYYQSLHSMLYLGF